VVVGSVEIDKEVAKGAEEGEGAGGAVDELATRAFGGEGSFEEQATVFAGFGPVFFEEGGEGRIRGMVEDGFDGAGVGTGADEALVGAFAEEESEGADEDGFARAGLAGDGGETGPGLPRDVFDEGEIANAQGRERCGHGRTMP